MSLNTAPLNLDKDTTELWIAKGEDLSLLIPNDPDEKKRPKLYNRKNYNHSTWHIHNPLGVTLDVWICNYNPLDLPSVLPPLDHFQKLVPQFTTSQRIVTFGKAGFVYVEQDIATAGKVWIHVLSGQREQR